MSYFLFTVLLIIILLLTYFLYGSIYLKDKDLLYECGFLSYTYELYNYFIKYFFIAILFLLFDIEILLLYNLSPYLLFTPNIILITFIFYIIYFTLLYELTYIGFDL